MNRGFILCFSVFATSWLSFGDGKAIHVVSSSPFSVPDQTKDGIVPTADVPTLIQHIPRATDQSSEGAKNTFAPSIPPSPGIGRNNSTKNGTLDAIDKKANSTGPTLDSASEKAVVRHIAKRNVIYEPLMPFNFFALHEPCEFDLPSTRCVECPDHCMWMYNVRFISAGYYRNYMLSRTESFFFGQYTERLRRYEIDPHVFEYVEDDSN